MWLAGFDLLLSARSRSFVAAMLVGCSGCSGDDAVSETHEEAGFEGDAAVEHVSDARLDEHRGADTLAHPTDGAKPDVSSGDERPADVSAEAAKIALCVRLRDPQDPQREFKLSQTVGDAYLLLVNADCRVSRATRPPGGVTAFADWRNALYDYNLALWGCTAKVPAGFALLSTAFKDLSSADASLLIEFYLRGATTVLALTVREVADLRSDLQRLAGPLITNESPDYTFSSCTADAGAEVDGLSPADASGSDAYEAASADADSAVRDGDAVAHDAEAGAVDVAAQADAEEEMVDASADDEGGDD